MHYWRGWMPDETILSYLTDKRIDEMQSTKGKIKPYDKRMKEIADNAIAKSGKSVKPVAKDTNKTRRKMVKPTKGK